MGKEGLYRLLSRSDVLLLANDPGTSTGLCLQLIFTQRGETGAFTLDCGGVLRLFVSLKRESSTLALTANATWVKRDNCALHCARCDEKNSSLP